MHAQSLYENLIKIFVRFLSNVMKYNAANVLLLGSNYVYNI